MIENDYGQWFYSYDELARLTSIELRMNDHTGWKEDYKYSAAGTYSIEDY